MQNTTEHRHTTRMGTATLKKLDKLAKTMRRTRSDVVRLLIDDAFATLSKKEAEKC